jgi:phosphatidylglycerol---prolipoprotein diacylglyceryl transferase
MVIPGLATIPAPPGDAIHVGSFQLRAYGLMIALGVLAAVALARHRWVARGGDGDDITALAIWAVPAGLVGARVYHVVTDPELFRGRWLHVFAVWEGGLGIPGGIAAGVIAGAVVARRRGLPVPELLDVVAPALPLAQAIGRWGNWFNQELFGRQTTLPWALRVDASHRPAGYGRFATFHPTFLYESLWNLGLVVVLLTIERWFTLRPGRLFVIYVGGYALGRLWVEALRIDPANRIGGLRVNEWVSLVALVACVAVFLADWWRGRHQVGTPGGRGRGCGPPGRSPGLADGGPNDE